MGITAIAAGGFHNLALTNFGDIQAWGDDAMGQLGDGTFGNASSTPSLVDVAPGTPLANVVALFAGGMSVEPGKISYHAENAFSPVRRRLLRR
ncbi:MAG: hypothetical protein V3T05_00910 [Myxococcota bacterium]